jgi:hypothetical protein
MPNTDQAQADLADETVVDPLDATNTQNGISELSDYEAEMASLNLADLPGDDPEEPAADDDDESEDGEEPAEDDGEQADEETSEDDLEEQTAPASNRFRIRAKDDVEAEALALRKRHPDLSLKDCIAKAELILGVEVKAGESTKEEVSKGDTVESVNKQIEELKRLRKEATAEMEFDRQGELTDEIDDLREKRDDLKIRETRAKAESETKEQAAFNASYAKSEKLTVTHYPDTTDANSAMVKRMVELDKQMLELGDPLYHSPDKPFLLAKSAARELGVIMTKPSAATPAKSPRPTRIPMQPAPGNRGTTSTTSNQKFEAEIDGIETLEEYERKFGRG